MKPSDTGSAAGATPRVFSEAEHRANPGAAIANAAANGTSVVVGENGKAQVVILIPPAGTKLDA
jgi:hypothetical protein